MGNIRPRIAIPARLAESTSVTRYSAIVTAQKLAELVWDAGGEPLSFLPARHDARHARLSARRYERAACLLDLLALNRAARGSELTVAVDGEVLLQRVAQVEGDVDGHVCGEGLAESVELVEA